MEHPWILLGSMIASLPLIGFTLASWLPNSSEEAIEGGEWLTASRAGTWAFSTLPMFLLICAVHIAFVYNVVLWLLA
jgi:hypothetical protein